MFSLIRTRVATGLIASRPQIASAIRSYSSAQSNDAEFDAKWESYFRKYKNKKNSPIKLILKYFFPFLLFRPTLDGWELRQGINNLQGVDAFPEPKIVIAALEACRRLNEHSVAVRYLEALKVICFFSNLTNRFLTYLIKSGKQAKTPTSFIHG